MRKALSAERPSDTRPGGDDLPFVYSGSLIVRGQGLAEVTATGTRSEIGKIGKSLSVIENEPPPIQNETRRLVRLFAIGGVAVSVLFTVLYGWLRSQPGSMPFSAGSRSACRCCRKNFRSF